jgi:hypothetical protein
VSTVVLSLLVELSKAELFDAVADWAAAAPLLKKVLLNALVVLFVLADEDVVIGNVTMPPKKAAPVLDCNAVLRKFCAAVFAAVAIPFALLLALLALNAVFDAIPVARAWCSSWCMTVVSLIRNADVVPLAIAVSTSVADADVVALLWAWAVATCATLDDADAEALVTFWNIAFCSALACCAVVLVCTSVPVADCVKSCICMFVAVLCNMLAAMKLITCGDVMLNAATAVHPLVLSETGVMIGCEDLPTPSEEPVFWPPPPAAHAPVSESDNRPMLIVPSALNPAMLRFMTISYASHGQARAREPCFPIVLPPALRARTLSNASA